MSNEFGIPETSEQELARLRAENKALLAARDLPVDDALGSEGMGDLDAQGFPKEYVRLEIYPGREKHDLDYVPLGINGYVLKITRGHEVIIPKVFERVLAQAVEEITIQSEGGLITRPAQRFPYSVKGPATEAEYLAFRDKMRADGAKAAAARA